MNQGWITLVGIIFAAALWADGAHSQTLKIQGAPTEVVEAVRRQAPDLFDSQSSLSEIDQLVRLIMEQGVFEKVSAYRTPGGDVVIEAQSIKTISAVKIMGNQNSSAETLFELIGIKSGEKFDKKKIIESGERLKAFYADQGYFNTLIEVKFVNSGLGLIEIIFNIEERSPCRITSIEITTPNLPLKKKLEARLKKQIDTPLTSAILQKTRLSIEFYLLKYLYLSSTIEEPDIDYDNDRTTAHLRYRIKDPYQYDRHITGYQQLSIFDIRRAISKTDATLNGTNPIAETVAQLTKNYLDKGYAHVQISSEVQEDPKTFVRRAEIHIIEGPRVRLSELNITGRISRPPQYYAELIRQNSSPLVQRGYFNRSDLELGQKNLVTELRNQGYLKARIQSLRTEYVKKKSQAKVLIVMDEGPLTQVRKVEFKGAKSFSDLELNEVVSLKSNTPLHLTSIEESLNQLKIFYRDRGFLEMKIKNINDQLVTYNDKGTEANIRFEIEEGPKVFVSTINIEGNTFTKDYVILREIDFDIGDVLTPEKIEESQMRLNRTGIFSQVSIRTLEDGSSISQRTVVISLRERDPGLFKIGLGADSERELTLRQFTALSYNNIGGSARALSGRLEFGYNPDQVQYLTHRLTAGYLEPFLFGSRTRGRVNFTRQQEITDFEESTHLTEIQDSSRVDFLLERDLSRHLKLTWTLWSLDSIKTFERHGFCINGQTGKCPDQLDRIATIGPTIDYDLRDSPFVPTRGSHTRWNLAYSDPQFGSSTDVNFIKSEISYTYLWNLGLPNLVWANQVRKGYLSNLSSISGSKVPTSQIFFLGGTSTIRGFGGSSSNERIPQGVEFPNDEVVVLHQSEYSLIKSEFRFPIYDSLGGVIFYDGGIVEVSGYHFEKPYRHAAGFGIRFNTPVGPVSLDLGFKLNRIPARKEDPWRIHFFIGSF